MITQILVQQTLIMFILMIIGWILSKYNLLTEKGSVEIGSILLYLVIPCVIIRSYITEFTIDKFVGFGISIILAVVAFAVAIGISYAVYGFRKRLANFGVAFCNAGFIGIPLISATFGKEAAFYIAAFATMLNLLQWTYGIIIITGDRKAINTKKMFINPVCIAMIIGLVLFVTRLQLPAIILSTMEQVSYLNTPCAMLILGFYLSKVRLKDMLTDYWAYISCAVRLIVIPLITMAVLWVLPLEQLMPGSACVSVSDLKLITLIAASTPVGTTTAIFAQKFGQDYKKAVILVCLSTILSILTIPIVIMVAQQML